MRCQSTCFCSGSGSRGAGAFTSSFAKAGVETIAVHAMAANSCLSVLVIIV